MTSPASTTLVTTFCLAQAHPIQMLPLAFKVLGAKQGADNIAHYPDCMLGHNAIELEYGLEFDFRKAT